VETDPGEGRPWARIGGYLGEDQDGNRIWSQTYIHPQEGGVQCRASAQTNPGNELVYELFRGHFKNPIEIINKKFTLILNFNLSELEYEGSGLGIIRHELKKKLEPTDATRKVIGTRNNEEGNGDFVVYFDNVYVIYSE